MGLFGFGKKKSLDEMSVNELLAKSKKYANKGDKDESFVYTMKAAQKGHIGSIRTVANHYVNNDEWEEAVLWYRKGAEHGDFFSQLNLGDLLLDHNQMDEGMEWMKKAAINEDAVGRLEGEAARKVADCYYEQGDRDQGLVWITKAAEFGDWAALVRVIPLYYYGSEVEERKNYALKLLGTLMEDVCVQCCMDYNPFDENLTEKERSDLKKEIVNKFYLDEVYDSICNNKQLCKNEKFIEDIGHIIEDYWKCMKSE